MHTGLKSNVLSKIIGKGFMMLCKIPKWSTIFVFYCILKQIFETFTGGGRWLFYSSFNFTSHPLYAAMIVMSFLLFSFALLLLGGRLLPAQKNEPGFDFGPRRHRDLRCSGQ